MTAETAVTRSEAEFRAKQGQDLGFLTKQERLETGFQTREKMEWLVRLAIELQRLEHGEQHILDREFHLQEV